MDDAAGEMAIEVKFAAALVTVKLALDFKVPDSAVMVTVPEFEPVAIPIVEMLAIVESEEFHCTEVVTSLVLPSDICAVALNC